METKNFTIKVVENLPVPESGRMHYRDAQVRGLGILIQSTGHRSFYWYKKVRNYPHWKTIGTFPDMSIEQARARAQEWNVTLAKWKASGYEGVNPFERPAAPDTLDSLVDEYIARHLKDHAKNPDQAEASLRWEIGKYLPSWGTRSLNTIRADDVARFHRACGTKHRRTANKVVKTLRTLFNFARRAKLHHGENPAVGIEFYAETPRRRFLKADELTRLGIALRSVSNPDLADYVSLALWTRARKSDVLSMRWQDVSLRDNRWTIPNPKNRKPLEVPLTPEAVAILKARERRSVAGAKWVFPSHGASGRIVDLKRGWKDLLVAAKLYHPDDADLKVTQHDLRRTGASWMVAAGAPMPVISKSLGHQSTQITEQTYAVLDIEPVRQWMTTTNAAMAAAMKKKPKLLNAAKEPKLLKQAKVARRG
jgi:integrase